MKTRSLYGLDITSLQEYYDDEPEEFVLADLEPGSPEEYAALEDLPMASLALSRVLGRPVRLEIMNDRVRVIREES